MRNKKVKRLAYIALMLASALIIGIIESFIPPVIPTLPMIRLGLANVVVLFTYISFGTVPASIVLLSKCFLVSLFTGNFFSMAFSIPSGIISLSLGILLIKMNKNSLIMISALQAILHNSIQVVIASLVMGTATVFVYLPYLFVIGAACGMLTGFIALLLIKKMPQKIFLTLNERDE